MSFTCEVTGGDARKLFRNWRAWVHAMRGQTGELLEPMARAVRMFMGHLEELQADWNRRSDDRLLGGSQQPVLGREAQSSRVPDGGVHDRYVLLRRRETYPTMLLIPKSSEATQKSSLQVRYDQNMFTFLI